MDYAPGFKTVEPMEDETESERRQSPFFERFNEEPIVIFENRPIMHIFAV
jgi:hypothetical protein